MIGWVKLKTDTFEDEKIKIIESMPKGDAILIIWFKLILLAGKTNEKGYIYISENKPYTEKELSVVLNKSIKLMNFALQTLENLKMIERKQNNICIINFEKHQNKEGLDKIREQTKLRVAKYREKQKDKNNENCNVTVTQSNATEKEIDKETDNIYLFLFNKYKAKIEKIEKGNFGGRIRIISELKNEQDYNELLTPNEQDKLFNELMNS